jgi:hypothetical protein
MDFKGTLKAITLELRRELEGRYDARGIWQPGDLERRLASLGVWRDRPSKPVDELPRLTAEDGEARRVIDAFIDNRRESGKGREAAISEFVRGAAYTWANRLLALRCMEARGLIDEVILQKDAYGGRSLLHNRLAKKEPERCAGEDEGLFAALFDEFARRAEELPLLFDPRSPEVALRPSIAALKRCVGLLSGRISLKGQETAIEDVFTAPDALGWTYQYWNTDEKTRVFEKLKNNTGKIDGIEIIPATCIYTDPYIVRFLIQNSLGAIWMGMHPDSHLADTWEYYARGADRRPVVKKPLANITVLDPACGSGHFLVEAFELLYAMYLEEGALTNPAQICASILERNLYGIDIDERAIQVAALALFMKAKEKAADFKPRRVNLVATNIRLPANKDHLDAFLAKHPEDAPLKNALLAVFLGLAHADQLGSLLQIEEPLDRELRHLRGEQLASERKAAAGSLFGPRTDEEWVAWKREALARLQMHFSAESQGADLATAFFGEAATKGLSLIDLLARRYDVVAANPPYASFRNVDELLAGFLRDCYPKSPTDTYSAMLWRALDLLVPGGRLAFVTQDGMLLLPSLSELRHRLLTSTQIDVVVHLGPRAFADVSGEKVSVALTVAHLVEPFRPPMWVRLVNRDDKASALKQAISSGTGIVSNGLLQTEYLRTRGKQWLYFAPRRLVDILANQQTLETLALVKQGVITGDNDRYIRYWWEVPRIGKRWRWYFFNSDDIVWGAAGLPIHVIDWRDEATWRFIRPRAEELRFREGIAFGRRGKDFRATRLPSTCLFDVSASSALFHSKRFEPWLLAYLSSPLIAALLRALNVSLMFLIQDVAGVPVPADIDDDDRAALANDGQRLLNLRADGAGRELFSASFQPRGEDAPPKRTAEEALILSNIDHVVEKILGLTPGEAEALRDLASAVVSTEGADADREPDEPALVENPSEQVADLVSHLAMRILGHTWPVPPAESVSIEADGDGIVPLTEGTGEPTLATRIRSALPETESRTLAVKLGMSLDDWLLHGFFKRHVSQFKKRPAVWHIQSEAASRGTRSGRGPRKTPAFACLVYCGRVDSDLIPKLRSQYVGPLRKRLDTELMGLERLANRTPDQDARRLELELKVQELKSFDARLEQVLFNGFGTQALDANPNEPLDNWSSREGRARAPETRDAFVAQERRYAPDPNDGVRVNIAPLQRAGVLAVDVLAAKDVEKAIADRAEWRESERRWCREGRLPQPGWWPAASKDAELPEIPGTLSVTDASQEATWDSR